MRNACISLILLPLPITIPQPAEISMPKSPREAEYNTVNSLLEVCREKNTLCFLEAAKLMHYTPASVSIHYLKHSESL